MEKKNLGNWWDNVSLGTKFIIYYKYYYLYN